MRKWLIYLEFFLTGFFFIILPLCKPVPDIKTISFDLNFMSVISAGLFLWFYYRYEYSLTERLKQTFLTFLLNIGKILLYFGFLILINLLLTIVSILYNFPVQQIGLDDVNLLKIISGLIKFFVAAFFEESLYRLYFPSALLNFSYALKQKFFNGKSDRFLKVYSISSRIFIESFCIIIFALGHRYLGIIAVINALLSGILLRIICIKNKSILYGAAAHYIYNIFIVALTLLLKN